MYKIKVRNLKTYLKRKHYGQLIDKNLNNNKKLWQIFNDLLFNKNEEKESIKQIKHENVMIN